MKITPIQVTIADLTKNYKDDGDGGVYGYDGKLLWNSGTVYWMKQRRLRIMTAGLLMVSTRLQRN